MLFFRRRVKFGVNLKIKVMFLLAKISVVNIGKKVVVFFYGRVGMLFVKK